MGETWDFHGDENSCRGLLGYDIVWGCGRIFQPEDEGSMVFRNVGILPRHHIKLTDQQTNKKE